MFSTALCRVRDYAARQLEERLLHVSAHDPLIA
jgi:hypothetical protein